MGEKIHPFPDIEPELTVIPKPEAGLKEVLRVDAGGFFVPLEIGAEVKWSFYDWPERKLTNVSQTRVVGLMRYRGDDCLEVVDRIIWPEEETWATRWLYRIADETLTWVLREVRGATGPATISDADVTPFPLRLRSGLSWEGHEVYRCGAEEEGADERHFGFVDGPFDVTLPAGRYTCLRETWWILKADGAARSLAELYVTDTGRSIYFRRFNGPAWRNYDQLAGNPEREHEGVVWRLWYECLPEIALTSG